MKKKFIFLAMMLLTLMGGVKLNVLNAQSIDLTKQYRIKALSYNTKDAYDNYDGPHSFGSDMYLHITSHSAADEALVWVLPFEETPNQIFSFESTGTENVYYLRSADGYYLHCYSWHVGAYSTDLYSASPIGVSFIDDTQFYLMNGSLYFKAELGYGSNDYKVYCDFNQQYMTATWSLEEVPFSVAVSADATEIWSDESVNLTATPLGVVGDYCSYNWSPATGLDNASSATPVFTPSTVGTYTFTCTANANGETTTSEEITIVVKDAKDKPKGIIGDDSSDYSTLPGYNYYNYSISQQIYTKDEINLSAGTSINSISFKPHTINQQKRNWSVYLINTEKESFSSYSDYVALLKADCFYTGDVDFGNVGEWFEITFAEPFEYNGGNILICVTDNKGSYIYGTNNQYYSIYTDANCSVLNWNDNYAYDVTNPTNSYGFSSYQQQFVNLKSSIKFGYEDPTPKPQNLVASKTQLYPNETTTLTWDALEGAASYNVYVNDVKFNTEAVEGLSYELVNLPYGMNTIAVAAVYADDSESGMSNTVTVQMAGTFPLTIKVQDMNGNAVANASLTIEGYDEYYEYRTYEGTTDDNGEWYKADMPLLYEYFPYSIYVSAEPFKEQSSYFYESETGNGVAFTHTIEMKLPVIYPETEKQSYDANEDIVLFWNAVDSEYLQGYNVYVNDEETPRNTELLTSAIYTLEGGLAESGSIAVTAVYDVYGESAKPNIYININKYEYVKLSGTVTDGTNPIAGAEVVVEGRDMSWTEQRYTTLTNAEGAFELEVLPSYEWDSDAWYSVSVSKYGYSSYKSTEKYKAVVDNDIVLEAIVLTANADVTFAVTATEGEGNVAVTWEAPEGATQYNVFRKDATEEVVKLTETPITEQEYLATDWADLTNGTYQYGVSAFVGGVSSSEETVIYEENFEDEEMNTVPNGWNRINGSWQVYNTNSSTWGNALWSRYTSTKDYIVTPEINGYLSKLSFSHKNASYYGEVDKLIVYYATSSEGPWTNILYESEASDSWIDATVSLSHIGDKSIYIAFCIEGRNADGIYIDKIVVTGASTIEFESSINWATALTKNDANVFTGTGEWTSATNWSNDVPAAGANVFIEGNVTIASNVNVNNMTINGGSVTINNGASLTVEGTLVNEAAENLVINDGAQLFQNNEEIPATFVMNIKNWSENENAWQFIASPLSGASVFSHATGNYDLFKYKGTEDLEWYNHKLHAADFDNIFVQGVGYLASHETANNIVMTGTLNNKNTHNWYSLTYDYEGVKDVANFNLLGNPFTFNMKWSEVVSTDLVTGYAYLNENGGYETAVEGEIAVGDAFFVKAKSAYAQMSYGVRGAKAEQSEYINLIASGKAGRDNVIINLAGKQEGFTKMQNFNESIATVYVAEDNTRYGIYNCNSDIEEVVVSFNAKDMGDYTIAAVTEGGFSSVVLVDLFTGIETNLMTSGYTFAAKSGDNAERFVVRFSYSQDSANFSNFVYQSGEDLIIMAEGAVQIVDMLGRVVYYSEVATDVTRVNVSNFDNAAYIVRVVNGEGVKVQKIIL